MRHIASANTSKTEIKAIAAAIWFWLGWMVSVLVRLGDPRRTRRLEQMLRRAEREVECLLFLRAADSLCWHPSKVTRINRGPGFRVIYSNGRMMMKSPRVRLRGGAPLHRIVRLIQAMAAPGRYIARAMRRLQQGYCRARLSVSAPPARDFITRALAPPPALADSS